MPTPIRFSQTLGPMALATLAGVAALVAPNALDGRTVVSSGFFLYVLEIAFFAYVTAAVCVLPIFAIWPAARQPRSVVALVWGGAATACANYALIGRAIGFVGAWTVVLTTVPGAVSGLCYVWLARRQRSRTLSRLRDTGNSVRGST